MKGNRTLGFGLGIVLLAVLSDAALEVPARYRGGPGGPFHTEVPAAPFTLILGRPTLSSVTITVLAPADIDGSFEYAAKAAPCTNRTQSFRFRAGEPRAVVLDGLGADMQYGYVFSWQGESSTGFQHTAEYTFHTQRPPGAAFTFTVTADSHLDANTDPAIYARTLRNALADAPDFHIDLGDTFMTGKRGDRPADALPQYLAQRYYFGLLCHSAPLFLVLGNHDGEFGPRSETAARMRTTYFPNPFPDGFYTGHNEQNYYAWHWGDALFVVLDPFRYSERQRQDVEFNPWAFTLGRTQYDWLKTTLEGSAATVKFVFIHHLVGGLDQQGRGGAEAVPFGEWGGRNADGTEGFTEHRPGWLQKLIHALLVKNQVSIVFHGHDHFFARQEVDGIVYQLAPQPGHPGEGSIGQAGDYGYVNGVMEPGAGHLRVAVTAAGASVDFVRH